jgi:radical SAM superfamily enzyme YgiQ (UPF0313 family)
MFRILLAHMPFADVNRPSIGLGLLKAGLIRSGLSCDVEYLNLAFARHIGSETYGRIDRFNSSPQLGEWLFSECLFEDALPDARRYYDDVLRAAMVEPFQTSATGFSDAFDDDELIAGLITFRKRATEFVHKCLHDYDWASYDMVGFTSTFQQNTAALSLAKLVKQAHPHVLVAFGGANCEGKMGVAMHRLFPFIDLVCSGEGDRSFVNYAVALAAGAAPAEADGIIRRSAGKTCVPSSLTNPVRNMDSLPVPDYAEFFVQRQALQDANDHANGQANNQVNDQANGQTNGHANGHAAGPTAGHTAESTAEHSAENAARNSGDTSSEVVVPIESSRGCWWGEKAHCTFCGLNGGSMGFRTKSAGRFLEEVETLVDRYGVHSLTAVDNIIDMRYFQSVLPTLAGRKPALRLFYETKANLQRHQVRLLRESGVTHIQPGIESLSTSILSLMKKGVHAYQNIRLLRWCAEYSVYPSWNVLGGFPGEEAGEYAKQIEVMRMLPHLTPPIYVGPVRLDRFSPLFEGASRFAIEHVRPSRAYRYLYPFQEDDLQELAYFFEFDYTDGRDPMTYLQPVREAVSEWKRADALDSLTYLDDGEELTVIDGRPIAVARRYELSGLAREIFLACDEGVSWATLLRQLAQNGVTAESGIVEQHLGRLVDARLVMPIDDRYLLLAVSGNFRVEALARHLKDESQPPPEIRAAIQRVFDAHADGFGHHLSRHLS